MKSKFKKISFIVAMIIMLVPVLTMAKWDIIDVGQRAQDAGLTVNKSFGDIAASALGWLMGLLATISTLMFVVAGVMYVTASGDEELVTKAKKIIQYAITGMVIALCGFLIVEVIAAIAGDCTSFVCILLDIIFGS